MLGFGYFEPGQNQRWHPVVKIAHPFWPYRSQDYAAGTDEQRRSCLMTAGDFFYRILPVAAVAGLLAVICCSCAVHKPEPIDLHVPLPETYVEQSIPATMPVVTDRWWEAFGNKPLSQLMEKAFRGNLDIDQAVARLKQLEAVARQQGASRLPFVNLEGTASRSRQLGALGAETGNSYEMSIAVGFEVDLWNKLKSRTLASELESEASLEDLRTLYLTISAKVADLYYIMVEQQAQLELTEQTIKAREAALELVEWRYLEGVVSALDLYQARQNLAAARARVPEFEATLATTAHALSVLIGDYPTQTIGENLADFPNLSAGYPTGLPSELLKRRPDIRAALLRLRASDQEIGAAVAERFPSINLLADYGRAGADFGTSLSETVWSLIGNLTLPLLDWGSRKAEVDRTRALFAEQLGRYRQTVLLAFQEVEDALVGNRTTEEAILLLEAEEAAAGSALRLTTDRYLDGLSDYLSVLIAQTLHFDVQSRLLSMRRNLIANRISLARALGGSWMDKEINTLLGIQTSDSHRFEQTRLKDDISLVETVGNT
jgi:NodT family efflux transporter outer membrane factor (OMF) lipoprotein